MSARRDAEAQLKEKPSLRLVEHAVRGGAVLQRHVRLPSRQSQLLRHQRQEEAQPAPALHLHTAGR